MRSWFADSHNIDGIGHNQKVLVVKEVDLGHLHDEQVDQLYEEHEEEFTNAADLQEDGTGQKTQENAGGEVLREEKNGRTEKVRKSG